MLWEIYCLNLKCTSTVRVRSNPKYALTQIVQWREIHPDPKCIVTENLPFPKIYPTYILSLKVRLLKVYPNDIPQPKMYPNPKLNLTKSVRLPKMHPYQQCSTTQSVPLTKIRPYPKGTLIKSVSLIRNPNKIRWLQKISFTFCSRGCRIHFIFLQPRLQNRFFISAASGCRFSKRLQNP